MKARCAAFMILASISTANAQQVMDHSMNSSDSRAEMIANALVGKTPDPFSVQIIRIRDSAKEGDVFCGLINLKNGNGAYVGFQPFTFDIELETIFLNTDSRCST